MSNLRPLIDALSDRRPGDLFARVQAAAHDAATSPYNRDQPTAAQLEANSYRTGRVDIQGLPIRIENPRGTRREKPGRWSNLMTSHYGDIAGTKGNDGDPVDVFIGPLPELAVVYVINQRDASGGFDEHKVCIGYPSEADARAAYLSAYAPGWDGLESIVRATVTQLKWWLKFGDKSRPFTPEVLPYEGQTTMDKVLWNPQAEPVTKPLHMIMYELRLEDADAGLMLDAVSMSEQMTDPDIEAAPVLDAMVVEVGRLQPKMEALQRIMAAAGGAVKPTEVSISDPVRYRGVAQVMVVFSMDDGQTVSVWFHNPDTTPAKLMPLDELISWKWMLNKKDVTIVVAPEKGRDLNPREVARRMMRLVERNTEAFKKANAKTAERAELLQSLDTEIAGLEGALADLSRKIEVAKVEAESRPKQPLREWQLSVDADPAGGASTIDRWDAVKADALLNAAVSDGGASPEKIASKFVAKHLQGRLVKTKIGECVITSTTAGHLGVAAGRSGGLKLRCIARVPEVLIEGDPGEMQPLSKTRKDAIDGFYWFSRTVEFDAGDVRRASVRLSVGHRPVGLPLVYEMHSSSILDAVSGKNMGHVITRYTTNSEVGANSASNVAHGMILDQSGSVVNDDDGLNIEILQAWDADGNEIDPDTGELLAPVATEPSFDDFLAAVIIELATKGDLSPADAKKLTDGTNLVHDGFADKMPAEQVADQILAANKRSPNVERAYAIAEVLISQYGWSKSLDNDMPEMGINLESPRDAERWVYLGEERGMLDWDAIKSIHEMVQFGGGEAFAALQNAEIAMGFDKADFNVELSVDDDGMVPSGEEFEGKTPEFAYAAEVLRKGATAAGAVVQFGDFTGSATASMFDKAPNPTPYAEASVYGITAQIGYEGKVLARAAIDEAGALSLLRGSGGESYVVTKVKLGDITATEVRAIVQNMINEEAMKPAAEVDPAPVADDPTVPAATGAFDGDRAEWDGLLIRAVEEYGGVDTSDAQGIVDARPGLVAELWDKKMSPEDAAQAILNEPKTSIVDAAYKFDDATDAFKEWVVGSIDQAEYSPFATSKAIDEAVKKHGGRVSWDIKRVMDSIMGEVDAEDLPDGFILDGAYTDQDKKAVAATVSLLKYLRAFIDSDKELARNPMVEKFGFTSDAIINKDQAQKMLTKLVDVAISRKGGEEDLAAKELQRLQDFQHDARVIEDYFEKRIRNSGSRNMLRTPEMKKRYPEIDNPDDFDQYAKRGGRDAAVMDSAAAVKRITVEDDTPMKDRPFGAKQVAFVSWGTSGGAMLVDMPKEDRAQFGGGTFIAPAGEMPGGVRVVRLDAKAMTMQVAQKVGDELTWTEPVKVKSVKVYNLAKFTGAYRVAALDSVEDSDVVLDAADGWDSIVGTIKKGAKIVGRAHVGGDGKAMVFVGKSGNTRVQLPSGMNDGKLIQAMWSDDDAGDMVDALFTVSVNGVAKAAGKEISYAGVTYGPSTMTEADSADAWNAALAASDGDAAAAAKNVYKTQLQGTYVQTNKGDVLLSGQGWREMKAKLDGDRLRCKTIPYIPHLLKVNDGVDDPLSKPRSDFSGFIKFDGMVTVADGTKVRAVAKVGIKAEGQLMYFLRASDSVLDNAKNEGGGLPQVKSPLSTPSEEAGFPATLDNTLDADADDVNLIILEAWDKDGNSLDVRTGAPVSAEPAPTAPSDQGNPMTDPAKAADTAYLQSMIDGTINLLDETLADKLEPLFLKYENDPVMMDLLNRAANAYGDAAVAAAKAALGA